MKSKMKSTAAKLTTCDLCRKTTSDSLEDTLIFGDWMRHTQLKLHYFCLLLSTKLPQRGSDTSGIVGFLVRDIRKEVAAARKRICAYCKEPGATIECRKCGKYFDLVCSIENLCTSEFCGEFRSYCKECTPMDEYRQQLVDHPPHEVACDICMERIVNFNLRQVVYPDCCRMGFAHKMCMRKYAVSSGYYLACIWCRSTSFRDSIRLQGIFVPDRDAVWERQKNAYRELYRRTLRCEEKQCLCSHGRSYNKNTWYIYACQTCGSVGAHAKCMSGSLHQRQGSEGIQFKCAGCQEVEKKLAANGMRRHSIANLAPNKEDHVDTSFFVPKEKPQQPASGGLTEFGGTVYSDNETDETNSNASVVTVIPNPRQAAGSMNLTSAEGACSISMASPTQTSAVVDITDSQPQSQPGQDGNTKPLVLRESYNCLDEPFFYLVIYEFDGHGTCKGSCTLRFDDDDRRIKDRSQEALQRVQIRLEDIYFRNKDCGIYDMVHK